MKRSTVLLVAFFCVVFGRAGTEDQDRPLLVFTHTVIIDGNGGIPIEDDTLIVRGNRIETVAPSGKVLIPSDADIRDLSGRALTCPDSLIYTFTWLAAGTGRAQTSFGVPALPELPSIAG